jgi:transcriptional regulator with XRE-family HTH domain
MFDDEHLGKALKAWRDAKNKTQGQVASVLHMNHSVVSDIENGKRKLSMDELFKFCAAIGVHVLDVMDEAYIGYRKTLVEQGQESGGWLLDDSQVSLAAVEERFQAVLGDVAKLGSMYLRFRSSEVEVLRANLTVEARRPREKAPGKRRGRPKKSAAPAGDAG